MSKDFYAQDYAPADAHAGWLGAMASTSIIKPAILILGGSGFVAGLIAFQAPPPPAAYAAAYEHAQRQSERAAETPTGIEQAQTEPDKGLEGPDGLSAPGAPSDLTEAGDGWPLDGEAAPLSADPVSSTPLTNDPAGIDTAEGAPEDFSSAPNDIEPSTTPAPSGGDVTHGPETPSSSIPDAPIAPPSGALPPISPPIVTPSGVITPDTLPDSGVSLPGDGGSGTGSDGTDAGTDGSAGTGGDGSSRTGSDTTGGSTGGEGTGGGGIAGDELPVDPSPPSVPGLPVALGLPIGLGLPGVGDPPGGSAPAPVEPEAPPPPEFEEGGQYLVQVLATPHEHSICAIWADLKAESPELFEAAEKTVSRFDASNGDVLFRLRVGAFATRQAASDFCARLSAKGHSCYPVDRTGA